MFEVGKKVICIKTSTTGIVKSGQIFDLLQIRKGPCSHAETVLDIGFSCDKVTSKCSICNAGSNKFKSHGVQWFLSENFAPYDDSLSELTDHDIIHSGESVTADNI